MTDKTRAWSKRWSAKMNGMVPGLLHAGNYCAATHWLKAVKAAGTTDADAVVAKMKATPVNDMYNTDVKIREDGRVMHVMHLWQVKPAAEVEVSRTITARNLRRSRRIRHGGRWPRAAVRW